ncbi:MAG: NAD(P)/FAD-dependent oxidoreductase [Acutalibacteraceae bacterium]|jgi:glycerol-3-phosphate dehydrogenase
MYDTIVIGCGIIGAATAFELSRREGSVLVLEKENDIATGATRANSAIIHAGYDPAPGTKMAALNVRGAALAKELCRALSVPYAQIGSLVLAFSEEELSVVQSLYERGVQNGVPGLRVLSAAETREMEPNVSEQVRGALYAPSAGIVNPWEYALALAETAVLNGVELRCSCPVVSVEKTTEGWAVGTAQGTFEARTVINATGVESEEIHDMALPHSFHILPSRGEYYLMDKSEGSRANHVLFQCPSALGKGVLVSPTVHGNLIVGPNAVAAEDKTRVNTTGEGLEYVRSTAVKSVPSLNFRSSIRNFAGMRANSDRNDFILEEHDGFVDLAGIKSPGLSSAPAIAEEALAMVQKSGVFLTEKNNAVVTRRKRHFNLQDEAGKRAMIAENPLYGRVICRCETVTEGEILDAIHSPIPPRSVDGIKRRCNAGMGRCQGGFCGPRVLEILSRELKIAPESVKKDLDGSEILIGEDKNV